MPKAVLPLINNPNYSEILIILSNKNYNSYELEKFIHKNQATIFRHIQNLKKNNYIKKTKTDKSPVNFDKIAQEFITYIQKNNSLTNTPIDQQKIINEKLLQNIIQEYLAHHKDLKKYNLLIKDIFDAIIIDLISLLTEKDQITKLPTEEKQILQQEITRAKKMWKTKEKRNTFQILEEDYPETNTFIQTHIYLYNATQYLERKNITKNILRPQKI
jgi:predicted transcriptional regulator